MTFSYKFPRIECLEDVTPYLDDCFRSIVKDGLIYVNYVQLGLDTFPPIDTSTPLLTRVSHAAMIRRECRGIVFDERTHRIVSRPIHKFFNVGEREEIPLESYDLSQPHEILEKLDGSMIRPIPVQGGFRWGTKMGLSDTALLAEEYVASRPQYAELARVMALDGFTPCLEFCSPRKRIVEHYDEDSLTLLAVRDNITGEYLPKHVLRDMGAQLNIPVVRSLCQPGDLDALVNHVRDWESGEGIVLSFADGHCAKIKAEAYVRRHKAVDSTRSEADLLDTIFREDLDDLLPILSEDTREKVRNYVDSFHRQVDEVSRHMSKAYLRALNNFSSRGDYVAHNTDVKMTQGIVLDLWNGKIASAREGVLNRIKRRMSFGVPGDVGYKNRSSQKEIADLFHQLGLNTGWDEIMYGKEVA